MQKYNLSVSEYGNEQNVLNHQLLLVCGGA